MRRWAIVNTLLGIIVALVGFEIARTWASGLPTDRHKEDVVAAPPGAAPPAAAPEAREKGKRTRVEKGGATAQQTPALLVTAISEKDLFDPSRHPPTVDETATAVAPVTKPPDNVTVVGVRIFGKDREVFVNDASQNPAATKRLRVGDQVQGYTVKAIGPAAVMLASPSGDMVNMPLSLDKGKAQPSAPGPGPRPAVVARPGQAAQVASPAAGPQGPSPAAGVGVKPRAPAAPAAPVPAMAPVPGSPTPATAQLPSEVRQKLDQLKQNDKRHKPR